MPQPLGPVPQIAWGRNPSEHDIAIRWFAQLRNQYNSAGFLEHNDLAGLQGGTTDEYYHLTAAQSAAVANIGSLTEGSVIFAGPSGVLAQDNANFFWDDTNNRLGIGTNTPGQDIQVVKTGINSSTIQAQYTDILTRCNLQALSDGTARVVLNCVSTVHQWDISNGTSSGAGAGNLGIRYNGGLKASISSIGQLQVPLVGSTGGILIGGDTQLYRSAGDILRTPDSLTVDSNLVVSGNTTLGDAAADTLTINAGVLGANMVFTRAVGAIAAAATAVAFDLTVTATGDAAGNSTLFAQAMRTNTSGANNFTSVRSVRNDAQHSGSGAVGNLTGFYSLVRTTGTGVGTLTQGYAAELRTASTVAVTTADGYLSLGGSVSGGGFTTLNGFRVSNIGNALTATAVGLKVDDFTASTTMRGIQSSISSGTGKANLYLDGTADNILVGNVRIGSTTAPTVALDVTGAALISTTLGVTGNVTATADLAVNGGDITSSATTFNLLNATVTTLNIGGAATTLAMGAGAASSATLAFTTGIALNTEAITSNQTTVALLNATATTINFAGGASAALNIGNASGLATVAGPLRSVGNFDVNTNKFTVTASNGNTLVAGTLDVTGNVIAAANMDAATYSAGGTAGVDFGPAVPVTITVKKGIVVGVT